MPEKSIKIIKNGEPNFYWNVTKLPENDGYYTNKYTNMFKVGTDVKYFLKRKFSERKIKKIGPKYFRGLVSVSSLGSGR